MRSVGPVQDSDQAVQAASGTVSREQAVVAPPIAAMLRFGGNRAVAAMISGQTAPRITTGRPVAAVTSLDDSSFNATSRAHDLVRAVDSCDHTVRLKNDGPLGTAMSEDVDAERRTIDFPAVVTALDGLTASQVAEVERVFTDFDKTNLNDDLFGLGESGRKADLAPDQQDRLKALLAGTKAEPIPLDVLAELRAYPPEAAVRVRADLERQADAGPALHRHEADAAELHALLAADLDEARRERVMTLHRRPLTEIDAVDACYDRLYGAGVLAGDLNRRLDGLQRMRMAELREGNLAQADACAIEDKRRAIEAVDKQEQEIPGFGYGDAVKSQLDKQRQKLTADIMQIVELNKREALADQANPGGAAVAARLETIMKSQDGEAGTTLGGQLAATLDKQDAAMFGALTDASGTAQGSGNLVQAAAAQLAVDEKDHTTSAVKIGAVLKSFRGLARHDLTAEAFAPATTPERRTEIAREKEIGVTKLAQCYIGDFQAAYDRLAGTDGRTFEQILASASGADQAYLSNLTFGGGETSDLGELDHAMGRKDLEGVKKVLGGAAVEDLVSRYNALGGGRDLRRQLFGVAPDGRTATPEVAGAGNALLARDAMASGRDAAQLGELLRKPGAGTGTGAEAAWVAEGGTAEYQATMDNRGATGRLREIGDDPETERLLDRTHDDLAALKEQFDAETDPARREQLLARMHKMRATLTGDAAAYEKDNARVLGEIRSALSFAVSIALAVAIPGAGPGLVAFLQTTAVNIAANVAANFVIKGGDYGWDDLRGDVLGGVLGAGGAKFGEQVVGKLVGAVVRPAAEATTSTAGKLGVQTVLAREAVAVAGGGEQVIIRTEEFEIAAAVPSLTEKAAKEAGGFFGGIYGGKLATGDLSLSADDVLKALAVTAAGKAAHAHREAAGKQATEEAETANPEVALPVGGPFVEVPEGVMHGPVAPSEMLLNNGLPAASARGFQQVADLFDIVIKVRPTNLASLPVLDAGGIAKPEAIKAKTVNRTDLLIGGPPDGLGKVGMFEPVLPAEIVLNAMTPELRAAVVERVGSRHTEFAEFHEHYADLLEQNLLREQDGVLQLADPRDGQFRDIGGDHDIYEITASDGSALDPDVRRRMVAQMQTMGINVEHADHVSWQQDSPGTYNAEMDARIRAQHAVAEPLVAFVPGGQPREAMAGDLVVGAPRQEGPGDRHLPAAGGEAIERDPAQAYDPANPTDVHDLDFSGVAEDVRRAPLFKELTAAGVRYDPAAIVEIGRDGAGKIIFLENGNARAGLQHIVGGHGPEFAALGIPADQVGRFVFEAVTTGTVVGLQRQRPIYEFTFGGNPYRVAVTVGSNGFIVGANPSGNSGRR